MDQQIVKLMARVFYGDERAAVKRFDTKQVELHLNFGESGNVALDVFPDVAGDGETPVISWRLQVNGFQHAKTPQKFFEIMRSRIAELEATIARADCAIASLKVEGTL